MAITALRLRRSPHSKATSSSSGDSARAKISISGGGQNDVEQALRHGKLRLWDAKLCAVMGGENGSEVQVWGESVQGRRWGCRIVQSCNPLQSQKNYSRRHWKKQNKTSYLLLHKLRQNVSYSVSRICKYMQHLYFNQNFIFCDSVLPIF